MLDAARTPCDTTFRPAAPFAHVPVWLGLTVVSLVLLQIEVAHKYSTVDTLRQQYLFIPAKYKDCYLAFVLNELSGSTAMVSVTSLGPLPGRCCCD